MDKSPSLWFGLLLAMIVGGALMAPAMRAQTPAPDFSQGFELLRKAGLPDVKGWKYVRFESEFGANGEANLDALLPGKQPGNAWLEPQAAPSKLQRILVDGSRLTVVASDSSALDYRAGMRAAEAMGLPYIPGKAKDPGGDAKQNSEAADAVQLAAQITKMTVDGEGKDLLLTYPGLIVNVFFMAAHYHRRGYEKESAQIVTGLQQLLPRPEALIELSVEALGNLRLGQGVARFRTDRDWKALQATLESVLADFPELWTSRPLAERLLGQVKARSAGQVPPPVASNLFPLTGEQQDWWKQVTIAPPPQQKGDEAAMMDMTQSIGPEQWAQAWMVKKLEIPDSLGRYWQALDKDSLLPFDASRDWDWIVVMAAAVGDNAMTMCDGLSRQGGFDTSWMSFDPEEPPAEPSEEELDQRWEQLGAPLTRDEIARGFLGIVLPLSEEHGSDGARLMSVEDLRESAKTWSAKTAGKTGVEVTRLYFKEGSDFQRRMAASALARTGDEKDMALLEESALNAPNMSMDLATQILQKRKEAGKPFLEKFKAKLLEEVKENSPSEEIPDYIKGQLTAMEGLVSGKGIKELIADYASGAMEQSAFMQSFQSMEADYEWKQEDIEAAFAAMGKIPASEGRRRYLLLEMTAGAMRSMFKIEEDGQVPADEATGSGAEGKPGESPPPEWVVKLLKEFIAQNREVKVSGWIGNDIRLSQYGCFLLDSLWKSQEVAESRNLFQQLPAEDSWSYVEARGMARLEGKQPPPIPDAVRVADTRKAEITAAAQKIKEGGWADFYTSLNLDEKMAANEVIAGMEPDDSWKKALLTVTEVTLDVSEVAATAAKPESWMALKGKVLDGALAKQVLELCQQGYKDGGKNLTGAINARSHHRGKVVAVGVAKEEESRQSDIATWITTVQSEDKESAPTAIAYVRWRDRSGSTGTMMSVRGKDGAWKIHAGDGAPPGFADMPVTPVLDAEAFEKAFADFLTGPLPNKQLWSLDFGVYKVPTEAAAKSE
ncbi:hypothetical protein [Roseimicrobium gellanilyticum]|uniref:hypothetical protein n=1 Tax=Roseimicrobium gellanilyticum TaxID=748857 RepID=UPI0011BF0584|nr:hypothetical protein [Roseimicrobium gellanilyticum]